MIVIEILNELQDDGNLCKWFKYAYKRMSKSSIYKASSIEGMLDHFHASGYDNSKILEIAKIGHTIGELVPQLVCI